MTRFPIVMTWCNARLLCFALALAMLLGAVCSKPHSSGGEGAVESPQTPRATAPARVEPASRQEAADPEPVAPPLVGTVWGWVGVVGPDPIEVARPGLYTLELEPGGDYAIRADCNTGSGYYELADGRLILQPGPTTLVACGRESLGDRFKGLLGRAEGYTRSGSLLVLDLGEAGAMQLAARRRVALPGTAWLVRGYNNGRQAVVSVAAGTVLTASFEEDGSVVGSAGCNRFRASYAVQESTLTIGPAQTTRMACGTPDGIMTQEEAFLAALGTAVSYEIRGQRLQLRGVDGSVSVDLVAAVTGTLTYRARMGLPRAAMVRVALQDVSLADAPARVLGEQAFLTSGRQVPLPFEVTFDPADLDARHSYAVSARILDPAGDVMFRTMRAYPVITRAHPTFDVKVELDLAR